MISFTKYNRRIYNIIKAKSGEKFGTMFSKHHVYRSLKKYNEKLQNRSKFE